MHLLPSQAPSFRLVLALYVVSLVTLAGRCIARTRSRVSFGLDDYLLWIAMAANTATTGLFMARLSLGLGREATATDGGDLVTQFKMQMAFDCLYTFTLWLVKVSVLVLYARLFPTQGCRLICWAVFIVCTGWALTFICIAWECLPIGEQQYKQAVPGACFNRRFDQRAVFIGYAVPNIATDLFILSMPVYRVWRMHVSLISRVGLILLLSQSVFVIFCSTYRFITVFKVDRSEYWLAMDTPPAWSAAECSGAIISVCLPTLPPLINPLFRRVGLKKIARKLGAGGVFSSQGERRSYHRFWFGLGTHKNDGGAITRLFQHYDDVGAQIDGGVDEGGCDTPDSLRDLLPQDGRTEKEMDLMEFRSREG